jgi:hypothetical protein
MPTILDRVRNVRMETVRRSPVYRVLQVLPTPARPWLLALETVHNNRERRLEQRFQRREMRLQRRLDRAESKKGGLGIGRMIVAAGLAVLAMQLAKPQNRVRISGFMKTPAREPASKT